MSATDIPVDQELHATLWRSVFHLKIASEQTDEVLREWNIAEATKFALVAAKAHDERMAALTAEVAA